MNFKIQSKTVDDQDDYYGTIVPDPYRWLEETDTSDSKQWLEQQHTLTTEYIEKTNVKARIYEDLEKYSNVEKRYASFPFGGDIPPQKVGQYYYYFKNSGLQHQPILYRAKELSDTNTEVILDTNELNANGTVSITNMAFDSKGEKLVYGLSEDGSDWVEIKVLSLLTGKNFDESLRWCKFCTISWDVHDEGFYYNRYPEMDDMNSSQCHYHNKIYWHKVGTPQSDDVLIYKSEDNELALHPTVSGDKSYIIVQANRDFNTKNQLLYKHLRKDATLKPLFNKEDGLYNFIGNDESYFYIYTNYDASKGRVIKVDIHNPEPENWNTVIAETEHTIVSVKFAYNHFIVCYLKDASHKLSIYDIKGNYQKDIAIPEHGSVTGITSSRHGDEVFISYTSFLCPVVVYRYSFDDGRLNEVFDTKVNLDTAKFEVKQYSYSSKDGTVISIYLAYKKGMEQNGDNPVLLNAYGGFNRARTPSFSASQIMWMEDGGIYALANVRGGAENGEDWHKAGMRANKQNVFDDFIAAAQWLIDKRYTNPKKLAISGRSNGGLLVAACMVQCPDLFGAVICEVPVIDMLRYPKFTIGRFWVFEFGAALEGKKVFDYLYAYSPLHNVKKDVTYPPILITSGDTDTRVDPMHAKKFTATLHAVHRKENPVLLRIDEHAGHGFGKPVMQLVEEHADIYSFLYEALKIKKDN